MVVLFLVGGVAFSRVKLVPKEGAVPSKKIEEVAPQPEPDVVLLKKRKGTSSKQRTVTKKKKTAYQSSSLAKKTNSKKKSKETKKPSSVEESPKDGVELEGLYEEERMFLEGFRDQEGEKTQELERHPSSQPSHISALFEAESKYKGSEYIQIDVQKEVVQELLGRSKIYEGKLYLDRDGNLKLEITKPQRSTLLISGQNIYTIDYPQDTKKGKVQVLRSKRADQLESDGLLSVLIGTKDLSSVFEIKENDADKEAPSYILTPILPDLKVQNLQVSLDIHGKVFKSISYEDSLGNRTMYIFKSHDFSQKAPTGIFDFVPPENSSITDL